MIMKMHSYISVNGYLQSVSSQCEELFSQLYAATSAVGGWDKAVADATARRAELDAIASDSEFGSPSVGTPASIPDATHKSYIDAKTANELRRRLKSGSEDETNGSQQEAMGWVGGGYKPHTLVDHLDESIAALARDWSELDAELVSSGPNKVRWPNNITLKNFAVYQLIPSLVYELEYPRTNRCVCSLNTACGSAFESCVT